MWRRSGAAWKLPCLKYSDGAKEPPALLKATVTRSSAWQLFQQAVKGNHPWTDNSWQQCPRHAGTMMWHHPTILIHVCWVLGGTGEPSWLSMSSGMPGPPQLMTDGFMGSSSCQFIKRRLMLSGNRSWSDGLELLCDVPSPCCTCPCAQCRSLRANSLSAKQKGPAQLFVTQLNPPRGLFKEKHARGCCSSQSARLYDGVWLWVCAFRAAYFRKGLIIVGWILSSWRGVQAWSKAWSNHRS